MSNVEIVIRRRLPAISDAGRSGGSGGKGCKAGVMGADNRLDVQRPTHSPLTVPTQEADQQGQ